MSVPQLTYNISHYVQNSTTGAAQVESFSGMPTDKLKFSHVNPYNLLTVKYTSEIPLAYYEVRATAIGEAYGIGKGDRLYVSGPNIPSMVEQNYTITFTSENLTGDGDHLLGFYAKNETSDGLWDVRYLLISSDDYIVATNNYDGIEVLTDEAIPSA